MFTCNIDFWTCFWLWSYWAPDIDFPLPKLSINPDTITMSGMSSGSFMTNNLHVIYSDVIKGVGLVVGGAYGVPNEHSESANIEKMVSHGVSLVNKN